MLVLSRRCQDRVVFPALDITVHVLRISGSQVRLGIEAPAKVEVLRHELSDERNRANLEGACVRDGLLGRSQMRALIVDDNRNEANLLASYLRLKSFEVETASDGADAMRQLAQSRIPDVLLLDMNMPRFNGRWTVEEIRKNSRYQQMLVVAVSGVNPVEYGVKMGTNGCNHWFPKPLNPQLLVDALTTSSEMSTASAT